MFVFFQKFRFVFILLLTSQLLLVIPAFDVMAQPIDATRQSPQTKIDSILVVVNRDVITYKELEERTSLIEANMSRQGVALPPRAELEKQLLEHLIIENIQVQMAKERGIRIDDRQLDASISMIAEQNSMTVEAFQKKLEGEGLSMQSFRERVRNDIMMQRLRDYEVVSKIEISDSEVNHFLDTQLSGKNPQQMSQEVHLGHILIRIPENASSEQIAGRRDRAELVYNALKAGADFQQNAATYSDADDGPTGGDMGWRTPDRLPTIFVEAIANLKTGEISEIIKSPNGFHILKVMDRRDDPAMQMNPSASVIGAPIQQIHARHILIRVNQLVSADEAKHKLTDLRERLVNKAATFEELARLHSNDNSASKGGDLGWIYPGDTVPEFEKVLLSLNTGEISEPVETPFGFHLIEVLERKTEDASSERKRIAAKNALRERKIEEATEEWLRQIRDRAYVEYRREDNL